MKSKKFQISYCIGVYNEERIVLSSYRKIVKELSKIVGEDNFEVIIVDNGSVDKTYSLLKSVNKKKLKVFHTKEKGHGLALKIAVQKAKYNYCVITAIDIPFGFDDLIKYSQLYKKYDIVFGSKAHPESTYNTKVERKLASYIYRYLLFIFFGLKIKDPQGSILFERKKVLPFIKVCDAKNAFFTTQIAIHAHKAGLRMLEIPVTYRKQKRKSKYGVLRDGKNMLRSMLTEFYRLHT